MKETIQRILPPAWGYLILQRALEPFFDAPCLGCGQPKADPLCKECQRLLRYLPPEHCDRCQGIVRQGICPLCGQREIPFERVLALGAYRSGLRNLLRHLKYHKRPDLGYWLGERLVPVVAPFVQPDWLVVPIPIHQKRRRERGYNQTEPIAFHLARRLDLDYRPDLLYRRFSTQPSYQKSKKERWSQAAEVFQASDRLPADRHVLLVDDIMTTGATAWEAAMALRRAGARSVHLAIAARAITACSAKVSPI